MQSSDIIKFLKSPQSKELIAKYWNIAAEDIVLRDKDLTKEERRTLASVLNLYKKAKEKLPEYVTMRAALDEKSYEQASSQAVASFRASLIQVDHLLNLSGGIGADDLALSKTCKNIISVDANPDVHHMAVYNNELFKINNVLRVHAFAEDYIKTCPKFNVIYVDPDRRINNKRTALLEEATPNIVTLQNQFFAIADEVYVKLSPLTDLTEIKNKLNFCHSIWVVSVENEVKEVLVKLSNSYQGKTTVYAVMIGGDYTTIFTDTDPALENSELAIELFIEPAAAMIKSGLADFYFGKNDFEKVGTNSAFYIGKSKNTLLPGRAFVIKKQMPYKPKLLNQYLIASHIQYGHFKKRDFPLDVAALKKKHKLKDGGNDYFFFFTDSKKTLQVVHACKPSAKHSLF